MSDTVQFKRGQSANVDSTTIVPGQVLVSTDTGEMHVDYTDNSDSTNKRVQIKDSTKVEDVQLSDPYNNNKGIDINIIKNGSVDSSITMRLENGLQANKYTSNQSDGETVSTLTTYELGMIPPVIMVGNRNSQTMTYINNLNEEVEYNKITFDKYNSSLSSLVSMTDKDFRKDRLYVDADENSEYPERIYRWIEFKDKNYVTHSTFVPLYSDIYDEIINSLGYTPAEINDNQISSSTTWSSSKISNTITNTLSDTKVTNTLATTTKAYITGTASATTNTGTQVFDTGVYLDTTAGSLHVDNNINCGKIIFDLNTAPIVSDVYNKVSVLQQAQLPNTTESFPIVFTTNSENNHKDGSGICITGAGLTVVAGGENGALGILQNAANRSGTTVDISGTSTAYVTPQTEELVLVADNGVSFFPGTTDSTTNTDYPRVRITQNGIEVNGTLNGAIPYGLCSTGSAVAEKVVSVQGKFVLITGARVVVKFNNNNTTNNPTLNVNNTGEKAIYYKGAAIKADFLVADKMYHFIYNGTQYELVEDLNADVMLYAGSGTAENTTTTNGNTKLTLSDITNVHSNITIKGNLGTNVISNSNGEIIIGNKIGYLNRTAAISSTESENWQVVAGGQLTGNSDINILFSVTDNYNHANGILSLGIRCASNAAVTNQTAANGPRLEWISRHKDINPNFYRLRIINLSENGTATGSTWTLEAYHHKQHYTTTFEVLEESSYNGTNVPEYILYTNGQASATTGTTYISRDTLPFGGTWSTSNFQTENAAGITIGTYGKCTTATAGNVAIGGAGSRTTIATGSWANAFGGGAQATGLYSNALGGNTIASNTQALAIGNSSQATGVDAIAIGANDVASGSQSIVIGIGNSSSGMHSTVIGTDSTSTDKNSISIGHNTIAVSGVENVPVYNTKTNTMLNTTYDIGGKTIALGTSSESRKIGSIAIGYKCIAEQFGQFACGFAPRPNAQSRNSYYNNTTGTIFSLGNGYYAQSHGPTGNKTCAYYDGSTYGVNYVSSNAMRIDNNTNGVIVNINGSIGTNGADYAEFVKEWWDGNPENEDRVGYMVTIREDGKLHKAEENDYILGITSGNPNVIGNNDEEYFWKYDRDIFNRIILKAETVTEPKKDANGQELLDDEGNLIMEEHTIQIKQISEVYNPDLTYIPRKDRPEWDYVGMRGIVPCRDDGTCVAGGFCKCGGDGIATYCSQQGFNTYYVIERINDHVVSVEVK